MLYILLYISVVCMSPRIQLCLPSTCKCIKMCRNVLVFTFITAEYVPHWNGKQMSKYIKETPRRRITVMSSSGQIFKDDKKWTSSITILFFQTKRSFSVCAKSHQEFFATYLQNYASFIIKWTLDLDNFFILMLYIPLKQTGPLMFWRRCLQGPCIMIILTIFQIFFKNANGFLPGMGTNLNWFLLHR
jgi:hypothetical protein